MANEKVKTAQLNAMFEQLSTLSATPHEKVVKSEVGSILEKTLANTKVASVSRIRNRYKDFVPMGQNAYSPARTRRSGNVIGSNLIYYMQNRYPNALWSRLNARRVQLINRARAARGLARQSWLQIANELGIKINAPGYVATAIAKTGKTYKNVTTSTKVSKNKIEIRISNGQPTVNATGGARALQRAIQGRIKFFEKNASLSVFADIKKIAKAYPGLKIKI